MNPEDCVKRDNFSATLDRLVKCGWVSQWGNSGDHYAIIWTDMGRERRRWIRTINAELNSNEEALTAVLTLCGAVKATKPANVRKR